MRIMKSIVVASLGLLAIGCTKEENKIDNPQTYTFTRDGNSTVSFGGQTTRIKMADEIVTMMKSPDATVETLQEMYTNAKADGGDANPFTDASLNESTKSIYSKVAASKDLFATNTVESAKIKSNLGEWIRLQVEDTYVNKNESAQSGQAGQILDGSSVRYVNAKGFEYNQLVAKSLIGGLMTDQILNNYLSPTVLDESGNREANDSKSVVEGKTYTNMEHKWDEAYGYLFGLSTDEASPLSTLGDDQFLNKYLGKVNADEDFSGIASEIYEAFKLGRAAIVANDYSTRDKQADIIKEEISKVVAIRAVHYLQAGKSQIENNNYGSAFHDLSEGYGFVYSLRFTRKPGSSDTYFSKEEVDGYLALLEAGNGLWDITPTTLDEISEAIADRFDFTVAQTN